VIFCDDLGYGDIGCFGARDLETPRINRMAAEGARFTDFYVPAALCTPSRAGLMCGCYPQRIGMEWVVHPPEDWGLNPEETTIAEVLRSRGYATACVGKWHLGHRPPFGPTQNGFGYFYGIPYSHDMNERADWVRDATGWGEVPLLRNGEVVERPVVHETLTRRCTEESVRFIKENGDRPFFLYLPHPMPHLPLGVTEPFRGKSGRGLYGDVIQELDWSVGVILDTLAELDLDEETLVVFTSDNGPRRDAGGSAGPLRGGKGQYWEGGLRVPCVMRWPGATHAGLVSGEVATVMDLLPTFAGLASAALPERKIDGRDIRPLMLGRPGAESPHEAFYYYKRRELVAVRSGPWKLWVRRRRYKRGGALRRVDPASLYNLEEDIGERNDVASAHPEVVARLEAAAERARSELGDRIEFQPEGSAREGAGVRPAGRCEL
jgi:arylsulfatase/arylsulfatase A